MATAMDWGDGDYERTAVTLEPAAVAAIDAAGVTDGTRVLDLGCGSGNAALEAARRGGDVLAIDPSARLVDVCRAHADRAKLSARVRVEVGDASAIPAPDASFDVVVSVFAVIFAPDAERAADEMLRVTKPGGRIVLTSWSPKGPISKAGTLLREAIAKLERNPSNTTKPAFAWGDPSFVRALFESRGGHVTIEERPLVFTATSAQAWLDEQVTHHPIWNAIKRAHAADPEAWQRVHRESLAILEEANEDRTGFRTTSTYLLVTVTR